MATLFVWAGIVPPYSAIQETIEENALLVDGAAGYKGKLRMVAMDLSPNPALTLPIPRFPSRFLWAMAVSCSLLILPAVVSAQSTGSAEPSSDPAAAPSAQQVPAAAPQQPKASGGLVGTVVDPNGRALAGVRIQVASEGAGTPQETVSDENGHFTFVGVPAGGFHLSFSAEGFAPQSVAGVVQAGDTVTVPRVTLSLATEVTQVRVNVSTFEIAQEQLKAEEEQRVFGFIPNFYVTYVPDAAPLSPKQKFQLALKSTVDPVSFGVVGAIAGVQQANNDFKGYGQGAEGFGKRYGAAYADFTIGTFIGGAILPSVFKQDPRYFYKGTGSRRSRALYAIANSVICKGDNGHWQFNYSAILGSLAAGGISNLYYPASDRDAALTFQNTAIGIGGSAAANLIQEFLIRKLTPSQSKKHQSMQTP